MHADASVSTPRFYRVHERSKRTRTQRECTQDYQENLTGEGTTPIWSLQGTVFSSGIHVQTMTK